MKEIEGDIWTYHNKGKWITITTNGCIRKDGAAVMGKGIAKDAAARFPEIPLELGLHLKTYGNIVNFINSHKIITFPTKNNWWEKSDLTLIEHSCETLAIAWMGSEEEVYMVRPGCNNGQLSWEDVKPLLEKHLDDRFVIVERRLGC